MRMNDLHASSSRFPMTLCFHPVERGDFLRAIRSSILKLPEALFRRFSLLAIQEKNVAGEGVSNQVSPLRRPASMKNPLSRMLRRSFVLKSLLVLSILAVSVFASAQTAGYDLL